MQFLIMHRTNAHWESGATPPRELIDRVGGMIRELVQSGQLLAGEGLRPSSQGVRLHFSGGKRAIQDGPFAESKEVIAGFAIMKLESLDQAIEWVTKFAQVIGDVEIDIRPVTEAWDLGLAEKPPHLTTTRYLAAHKHRGADGCVELTAAQRAKMGELMAQMHSAGILLSAVGLLPSAQGACLKMSNGKPLVMDGPFAESKELLGGFIIIREESLQQAVGWAERYQSVVGAEQVEVRQVIEQS